MILLRPVKPHVAHIPLSTFRPVLFCVCVYVCLCVVTVLSSPSTSCVYYVLTFSWLLYIKKVVITLIIDGKGEKGLFFFSCIPISGQPQSHLTTTILLCFVS